MLKMQQGIPIKFHIWADIGVISWATADYSLIKPKLLHKRQKMENS